MTLRTFPYDTAEFLRDGEDIALFAEAILEDPDPALFRKAVDAIARAHGFARLSEQAGVSRRQLVDALRDPENDTPGILKAVLIAAAQEPTRAAAE